MAVFELWDGHGRNIGREFWKGLQLTGFMVADGDSTLRTELRHSNGQLYCGIPVNVATCVGRSLEVRRVA